MRGNPGGACQEFHAAATDLSPSPTNNNSKPNQTGTSCVERVYQATRRYSSMKIFKLLSATLCGVLLAGCMNLPQTKALLTPVGVIGVHSFAPPPPPASGVDFADPRRRMATEIANQQPQQPTG